MRYAGIIKNDFTAAPGVSTTFFVQGCPLHCPGCHNPETWDFNGGKEFTPEVLTELSNALTANNITRNFCVMGGEPLCPDNQFLTYLVISYIKEHFPNTKIYLWTGYEFENITGGKSSQILELVDYVIEGPYQQENRDTTLLMRGSTNQRIIDMKEKRDSE